jgi:hypothetical protein
MVRLRFLSRAQVLLAFPPPHPLPLFALNMPCRLAAVADALLGMVNSDLLLLLLLQTGNIMYQARTVHNEILTCVRQGLHFEPGCCQSIN